jgi:hypothetical protein
MLALEWLEGEQVLGKCPSVFFYLRIAFYCYWDEEGQIKNGLTVKKMDVHVFTLRAGVNQPFAHL